MQVPFTWKATGWFMIGWSAEFEVGDVKALKYFGEDLAAYRDESGELHVLEAHCKHLGAHIGATVTPVCLHWGHVDEEWRFLTGWPDTRSDDPDTMALRIYSHFSGLGFAMSAFEGSSNHRLIFACTPVDDAVSDMFYSNVPPTGQSVATA